MRLYFFLPFYCVHMYVSDILFCFFFSCTHKEWRCDEVCEVINNFLVSALYWKKKRRNHDDRWKKTENKAALIKVWKFVKVLMKCVCVCLKMYCAFLSPKLFKLCEIILFSLQTYYFFCIWCKIYFWNVITWLWLSSVVCFDRILKKIQHCQWVSAAHCYWLFESCQKIDSCFGLWHD